MNKLEGWRKTVMTAGVFGAEVWTSTAALFADKMDGIQWVSLQTFLIPIILGIFVTGNVLEHKLKNGK